MFRLTREVRFGVNPEEDNQLRSAPTNSLAGYPSLLGLGHYLALEVTLVGEPSPQTGFVQNIKLIDQKVRQIVVPMVTAYVRRGRLAGGAMLVSGIYERLKDAWPPAELHHLRLALSPFLTLSFFAREFPMIRLSQKFEFSASHRLHNPAISDEENQKLFGKCNNPHGHGHNYVLQVTVIGKPDVNGFIIDIPKFEQLVASSVIEPLDHRHLNIEIPEFSDLIPTVENIAMVIYRKLKPEFETTQAKLCGVTLWETSKTWCEYME
ncbi:MAG: 6-carboxytetrahydropterin synthase [Tepidisphaeraceae bacterium]|jgi:6-pyruvoyltetrahydropterin/6-carboxytetrahydropterin synthase